MSTFKIFSQAVQAQFEKMSRHELFVAGVSGDIVWEAYLAAFPEGTNPIFRERTEHDCSCCKNFIRNLGNVVSIDNGRIETVWDVAGDLPYPYSVVSVELSNFVRRHEVGRLFRTKERQYGAETSKELLEGGTVRTWDHFSGRVSQRHRTDNAASIRGQFDTNIRVFRRGLNEITGEALNTIVDLIEQNALYRGEEHKSNVLGFRELKRKYDRIGELSDVQRALFLRNNVNHHAALFRSTVIGTLAQDLSDGVDLERAVKSFEQKVAPTNYKRTTALITQKMIDSALTTLRDLGLESAVERRFANLHDVSVNNVLFVDNSVRGQMKDGLAGVLQPTAKPRSINVKQAEPISGEEFFRTVVPQAESIDLLLENKHLGNFMSLTAPVHEGVGQLFKWDNGFAWSYDGDVTDSIKERVKKAGGSIEGDLCCRLAWDYEDDLDFHMYEPTGTRISFNTYRRKLSPNGGMLDLDANGGDGMKPDPAENIFYKDRRQMKPGVYRLEVHNYSKRRNTGDGFEVEIEFDGQTHNFVYEKSLRDGERVTVAEVKFDGQVFTIRKSLPSTTASREKWGLATNDLVPVDTLLLSPNHWDEQAVGNKHFFFILHGCHNPDSVRGLYNEFLSPALEKHRKVFEVLGAKMKCEPADDQLSGVGFSSTRKDSAIVSVKGPRINKTFNVQF